MFRGVQPSDVARCHRRSKADRLERNFKRHFIEHRDEPTSEYNVLFFIFMEQGCSEIITLQLTLIFYLIDYVFLAVYKSCTCTYVTTG